MEIRELTEEKHRKDWDRLATHPLQSWEWGEFRSRTNVRVARYGIFSGTKLAEVMQVTIHPIPYTPWTIGYFPKGGPITKEQTKALAAIAKQYRCVYIKCEPKIELGISKMEYGKWGYRWGRALFTKYNFVLDVTPDEKTLLANMKQKTRYNIRVAEKKGVTVEVDDSPAAFARYLQLTEETTRRQGFYAHSEGYHKKMWEVMHSAGIAHLLVAKFEGEIITTWVVFKFGDTLYYPYGASTREHREVMANNLVMWTAIKLAKEWKLKYLDMWGALGPEPDPKDPWYGFHTFKAGYGARQVEYLGTYDYVAKPALYTLITAADTVRWKLLRLFR